MSTILNTNGARLEIPEPASTDFTFHIVTADWNPSITYALRDGAVETLRKAGIKGENIRLHSVPGTVELVNAAAMLVNRWQPSGVIIIGCVIRGDTPHFDYVCQQAAQGAAILNARGETPVTFGVLTVDNLEQAQERAGGALGNKGAEAACAAILMANLHAI
ncbi:MAG: 6,7-dimethyl-8-ribityllumazine synthase [Muribaculaceae bacterium]|nr:6,7-dimethyl-8-ribityllumazine synthase [Muribaculaceae bacterium]